MLGEFARFVAERVGSLASKRLGAAVAAETVVAQTHPALAGVPLVVYIVAQTALEAWRYYVNHVLGVSATSVTFRDVTPADGESNG